MSLLRNVVRVVAGIVVVGCTLANFLDLSMSFGGLPARQDGELEKYESLFAPIRFALFDEGYDGRNLGYVSVRSAIGKPRDMRDDLAWSQLRYVAIPFILVSDPQGAPYVVGDYSSGDPEPESVEGYAKIYERAGMVLYKKATP